MGLLFDEFLPPPWSLASVVDYNPLPPATFSMPESPPMHARALFTPQTLKRPNPSDTDPGSNQKRQRVASIPGDTAAEDFSSHLKEAHQDTDMIDTDTFVFDIHATAALGVDTDKGKALQYDEKGEPYTEEFYMNC